MLFRSGAAFGLSEETLLLGANLNQVKKTGFDEDKDTYSIKRGIAIYQNYYKYKIKVA